MESSQFPADLGEHAEMIAFLRRFSSLMTSGENADNLLRCSFLIEDFTAQIIHMKLLLETARANTAETIALRDASEAELRKLNEELRQSNTAREVLTSDNVSLRQRAEQAEASLAKAESEVGRMRAALASIGKSKVIVAVPALESIRKQFEALAIDFRKKGDLTSEVMCEIGRTAINQAIDSSQRPNVAA